MGDWLPVTLIACFNLADLVGKSLPPDLPPIDTDLPAPRSGSLTWRSLASRISGLGALKLSVSRLAFVPLFWAATTAGSGVLVLAGLTFLLGVSNGYLSSLAMMRAPHGLDPTSAEGAGTMMVFFLLTGLTLGAFSGWLWLL